MPVDRGRSTGAVIGGGDARIRRRKPRTVFAHLGHVLYRDGRCVANRMRLSQHPSRFIRANFRFQPRHGDDLVHSFTAIAGNGFACG